MQKKYAFSRFLEFPAGCQSFAGNHTDDCIRSIREVAGLSPNGWNDPGNLTDGEKVKLNRLNLR